MSAPFPGESIGCIRERAGIMIDDLKKWATIFRGVRSPATDLLDQAISALESGEKNAEIAVELQVCALARDHLPEQQSIAALMRQASEVLMPDTPTG